MMILAPAIGVRLLFWLRPEYAKDLLDETLRTYRFRKRPRKTKPVVDRS
ncbi:MAG: hypothetical protein GY791_02080 [Alphaproteobacteria bacterium]|nr:hypothetical protein [Alphaproteobacteria bacterium]